MDAVSISRRTSIQAGSILGGPNSGAPQIGGSTTLLSQLVLLFKKMNTRPLKVEIH